MGTARTPEKSLESDEPYISQLQGRIAEKESIIITLNEKIQDVAKICSSLELKLKKSEEAKLHIWLCPAKVSPGWKIPKSTSFPCRILFRIQMRRRQWPGRGSTSAWPRRGTGSATCSS